MTCHTGLGCISLILVVTDVVADEPLFPVAVISICSLYRKRTVGAGCDVPLAAVLPFLRCVQIRSPNLTKGGGASFEEFAVL